MKMSIADALGPYKVPGYGDDDLYETYVDELASVLGLSPDKARRAAEAICKLAKLEAKEAVKAEGPSVSIVLGG